MSDVDPFVAMQLMRLVNSFGFLRRELVLGQLWIGVVVPATHHGSSLAAHDIA